MESAMAAVSGREMLLICLPICRASVDAEDEDVFSTRFRVFIEFY